MSSPVSRLSEAEVPVLIEQLQTISIYFNRPFTNHKTSLTNPEEIVEEFMAEISDSHKKAKESIRLGIRIHQYYNKAHQKLIKALTRSKALETQIEYLKSQFQDQQSDFELKEQRIETLTIDLTETDNNLKSMVNQNKDLKREIATLKKDYAQRELKSQNKQLITESRMAKTEDNLRQEEVDNLNKELRRQIDENESLFLNIKDLSTLLQAEKNTTEKLKNTNANLKRELDDARQILDEFRVDKASVCEQLENYRSEIMQQKLHLDSLTKQYDREKKNATFTSDADLAGLAEEIDKKEDKMEIQIEETLPRFRRKRHTMQIETENLGDFFGIEDPTDSPGSFFVLSSPKSKYGQFQSFVDTVKDRAVLKQVNLASFSVIPEPKALRSIERLQGINIFHYKKKKSSNRNHQGNHSIEILEGISSLPNRVAQLKLNIIDSYVNPKVENKNLRELINSQDSIKMHQGKKAKTLMFTSAFNTPKTEETIDTPTHELKLSKSNVGFKISEIDILKEITANPDFIPSTNKEFRISKRLKAITQPRDPIKDFFTLTCEAAKLNSDKRDYLGSIPVEILYSKVFEECVPFNKWHDYVQDFLHKKAKPFYISNKGQLTA